MREKLVLPVAVVAVLVLGSALSFLVMLSSKPHHHHHHHEDGATQGEAVHEHHHHGEKAGHAEASSNHQHAHDGAVAASLSGKLVDGVRVVKMTAGPLEPHPSQVLVREGEQVRLELTGQGSEDVTHAITIYGLDIARKLEPGKVGIITFAADKPGRFHFHWSVRRGGEDRKTMCGDLIVLSRPE